MAMNSGGLNDSARLQALFHEHFTDQEELLGTLLAQVEALYRGEWPQWQRCQCAYHNIHHIHGVLTVALQIYAGQRMGQQEQLSAALQSLQIRVLAAAALFHDSGYLKMRGDNSSGSGGQYTFEHVERSQRLAQRYLSQSGWSELESQGVTALIGATKIVDVSDYPQQLSSEFADLDNMLASADLLAQMADEYYLDRLPLLYAEFAEAYALHGRDALRQRGFMVFDSYEQLLAGSAQFIRSQVLPRLEELGNYEDALQRYFAVQPSPYMKQLLLNLNKLETMI